MNVVDILAIQEWVYIFLLCWVGILYGIYKSSYNISSVSYLNSPSPQLCFIPPPPILGIDSAAIIFAFTYMCTQFLYHIHSPTPFLHHFPLPTGLLPHNRTCSTLLFSNFIEEKRKKLHFCLFVIKVATQGVSLSKIRWVYLHGFISRSSMKPS
jgi:hypothetical protein